MKKFSEMFTFKKLSDTSIEVRADSPDALGMHVYLGYMCAFALDRIFGETDIEEIKNGRYAFFVSEDGVYPDDSGELREFLDEMYEEDPEGI